MENPEALLSHAAFLRGLARALVSDAARADDLVQETWLQALKSAPRKWSSPRAWLARVLRNTAITQRRRDSRRLARERCGAVAEALPSAAEIAEKEAVARVLADAVFRLGEPYTSTILYRYYEDLQPGEIARRQGVPVETVRTRLKRGLERLRPALDRELEGGRAAWSLPLAALSGIELRHTAPAASTAASGVPLATANAFTLGGILMSTKVSILSTSAAFVLAVSSAYLFVQYRNEAGAHARAESGRRALELELGGASDRLLAAEREIREARERQAVLLARVRAAARVEEPPAAPVVVETAEEPSVETAETSRGPAVALGEADQLAAELLARGDVEGLWLLGADLLALGEPGYAKLLELSKLLDDREVVEPVLGYLWREEELLLGRFIRAAADHADELLEFGLYLDAQDPAELSGFMREMREELADDLGPVFLGLSGDADPATLGKYVDVFRRRLEPAVAQRSWRQVQEMVRSLAQIRTEESTGLLVDLLHRVDPGDAAPSIVRALAWQGGAAALSALQEFHQTTAHPEARKVSEAALRYLRN